MDHADTLQGLLLNDPLRMEALKSVARLGLRDCWIGAGFVRDAVWDYLHGHDVTAPAGDVDVLRFGATSILGKVDREIESRLCHAMPTLRWSVKNQARMHLRNCDAPYDSVADAMRNWPETATALAVRLAPSGNIEINAPYGLDDLFALRLCPSPAFQTNKLPIFFHRVSSKRWMQRYPLLVLTSAEGAA